MVTFTDKQLLTVAVAGVALVWYLKNRAGDTFNPASQNNAVNTWFNDWYDGGTDGQGTLGTDVAEVNYEYSPYALADKVKEWWRDL